MNTGQMMLGVVALGLLTLVVLNSNKNTITTQDSMIYSKGFIVANTVALSLLDEIASKAYDEEIVNGTSIVNAIDFSSLLKPETGEVYPNFDDIDDYNNFTKTETVSQMGDFNILVKVEYLTDALVPTIVRTYNKNVTVKVTSPTMINQSTGEVDTLVITSILSQWRML
ncbi:MAG: hypothetical protein V3V16_03960 [Melioribacteraceae bacterium]